MGSDKGCIALHSRMMHFSYEKHELCISKPHKYTYQQKDKATAFREKVSKGHMLFTGAWAFACSLYYSFYFICGLLLVSDIEYNAPRM